VWELRSYAFPPHYTAGPRQLNCDCLFNSYKLWRGGGENTHLQYDEVQHSRWTVGISRLRHGHKLLSRNWLTWLVTGDSQHR